MQLSELETIVKSGEDSNKLATEIAVAPSNGNGGQIMRLTHNSVVFHADETLIPNTSEKNIDLLYFSGFFAEKYGKAPNDLDIPFKKLLENIYLLKNENLNLAGVLLFAVQPQFILPYRGLGSGILRSIKAYPKIEFKDDRDGNLFVARVLRGG